MIHASRLPFQEAPISQIPALQMLQQLGFVYLSPEECAVDRRGRFGRALREKVLTKQPKRLNKISFKGGENIRCYRPSVVESSEH